MHSSPGATYFDIVKAKSGVFYIVLTSSETDSFYTISVDFYKNKTDLPL